MTKPTLTPEQYNQTAKLVKVRCDACGWVSDRINFTDIPLWHEKACPACGDFPVVASLEMYNFAKRAIEDIYEFGEVQPETMALKPRDVAGLQYKGEGPIPLAQDIAPEFFPDKPRPKEVH